MQPINHRRQYSILYLEVLRQKISDAFYFYKGVKFNPTKFLGNPHYEDLNELLEPNRVSPGTLVKFFLSDYASFTDNTIKILIDFGNKYEKEYENKMKLDFNQPSNDHRFRLGGLIVNFVVVENAGKEGYKEENIHCHYDSQKVDFPEDLKDIYDEICRYHEEEKRAGVPKHWNGEKYGLSDFSLTRTPTGREANVLDLRFRPSDYFSFLTTTRNLDKYTKDDKGNQITIREKYLSNTEWDEVAPFMVNGFGVAITIITKDKQIILAERSKKGVGIWAGHFNASVNEGMTHESDVDGGKSPDPYGAVIRGTHEELNIKIDKSAIKFLTLGYETNMYQWGLQGMAMVPYTMEEIQEARSLAPKDKGENRELVFLPIDKPEAIIQFLIEKPWTDVGKVCVLNTLIYYYDQDRIKAIINMLLAKKQNGN